jgi:hypothetical protein
VVKKAGRRKEKELIRIFMRFVERGCYKIMSNKKITHRETGSARLARHHFFN